MSNVIRYDASNLVLYTGVFFTDLCGLRQAIDNGRRIKVFPAEKPAQACQGRLSIHAHNAMPDPGRVLVHCRGGTDFWRTAMRLAGRAENIADMGPLSAEARITDPKCMSYAEIDSDACILRLVS